MNFRNKRGILYLINFLLKCQIVVFLAGEGGLFPHQHPAVGMLFKDTSAVFSSAIQDIVIIVFIQPRKFVLELNFNSTEI